MKEDKGEAKLFNKNLGQESKKKTKNPEEKESIRDGAAELFLRRALIPYQNFIFMVMINN